ncbi:MAG: hypothetical protein HQM03_02865 [Magnetococcales bacterium]|nr:hypothetical protein [Magnetococcales bacterium]
MRIIVNKDILEIANTPQTWKLHLLMIFACQGRHEIIFDPPDSINIWLDQLDYNTKEIYKKIYNKIIKLILSTPNIIPSVYITTTPNDNPQTPRHGLSLDQALHLLNEPLGVMVENADNDWAFLLGILPTEIRKKVIDAEEKGWLICLHGGGSTLERQLEKRAKNPNKRWRTFVLFDSDRLHPDELQPEWQPPNRQTCQAYWIEQQLAISYPGQYWRLNRRSIESYMPHDRLQRASRQNQNIHADAADAFRRLSRDGQRHFNIKKGFAGDDNPENRHRCRELYDNVNDDDRTALARGFLGSLANHYQDAIEQEFNWDEDARTEAWQAALCLKRLL